MKNKGEDSLANHLPVEALEAMVRAMKQNRPTVTVILTPKILRHLAMGKADFIDGGKGPFLLLVPEKLVRDVYEDGHPTKGAT